MLYGAAVRGASGPGRIASPSPDDGEGVFKVPSIPIRSKTKINGKGKTREKDGEEEEEEEQDVFNGTKKGRWRIEDGVGEIEKSNRAVRPPPSLLYSSLLTSSLYRLPENKKTNSQTPHLPRLLLLWKLRNATNTNPNPKNPPRIQTYIRTRLFRRSIRFRESSPFLLPSLPLPTRSPYQNTPQTSLTLFIQRTSIKTHILETGDIDRLVEAHLRLYVPGYYEDGEGAGRGGGGGVERILMRTDNGVLLVAGDNAHGLN
jgi:hypothetical protein